MEDLPEDIGLPLISYKDTGLARNIDVCYGKKRIHAHIQDADWLTVANSIIKIYDNSYPIYISTISKHYAEHPLCIDMDGCASDYTVQTTIAGAVDFIRQRASTAFRDWMSTALIARRSDGSERYHVHFPIFASQDTNILFAEHLHTSDPSVDIQVAKNASLRPIYVPKVSKLDNGEWQVNGQATSYYPYAIYYDGKLYTPDEYGKLPKANRYRRACEALGVRLACVLWSMIGVPMHVIKEHWETFVLADPRKPKRKPEPKEPREEEEEPIDPMGNMTSQDFRLLNMADQETYFTPAFHEDVRKLIEEHPAGSPELMTYLACRFATCGNDIYRKDEGNLIRIGTISNFRFPPEFILRRRFDVTEKKFRMALKDFFLNWAFPYAPQPQYVPFSPHSIDHISPTILNTFRGIAAWKLPEDEMNWEDHEENINYIFWATWIRLFSCNTLLCWMFWNWVAHMVQSPHIKTEKAFILLSEEGTGKSDMVTRIATYILGRENVWSTSSKLDIVGAYSYWSQYLLVELSENIITDDSAMNRLKDIITNKVSSCNTKFKDTIQCANYSNFIVTSNSNKCLKIDAGPSAGRRWIVPDVRFIGSGEYGFDFDKWDKAWKESGRVLGFILAKHWKLASIFDYKLTDLRTKTRCDLRKASMTHVQLAYLEWLTTGNNYYSNSQPMGWHINVPVNDVHLYFCRDRRLRVGGLDAFAAYGVEVKGDSYVFPHTDVYANAVRTQEQLQREYDKRKIRFYEQAKEGKTPPTLAAPVGYIDPSSSWYPFKDESELRKELHECLNLARVKFCEVECDFNFDTMYDEFPCTPYDEAEDFIQHSQQWYRS